MRMFNRSRLCSIDGRALMPAHDEISHQPAGAERFERFDVRAGDRPAGASFASRSAALGRSGAAGTAHPLATLTAIETLKRGGSAADAAIAAAACLGFLEPTGSGLGGDCYVLLWDPERAKLEGLAGSGRSPRSLSLETVRSRASGGVIPAYGAISVSTPGALDAWWTLHRGHGVLEWRSLFDAAVHFCEAGVPVPQIIGYNFGRDLETLLQPGSGVEECANAMRTYAPDGRAPREGDIFRNPDLARTYRAIAEGGREVFYDGPIARTIDGYFKRIGGWLSREDLRDQHAEWVEPLVTSYRGVDVYAMGANTQGLATLQMLNILEHFDLARDGLPIGRRDSRAGRGQASRLRGPRPLLCRPALRGDSHRMAELEGLRRGARQAHSPRPPPRAGGAGEPPGAGDTTYLTVADSSGMMVSMIQSNYRGLGSGLVADGLGFMFQDRGQLFALEDGHPNLYQPGKRVSPIIPDSARRRQPVAPPSASWGPTCSLRAKHRSW